MKVIPNISVDCVVFGYNGKDVDVLLIKQKKASKDSNAQYALPGNLVFVDENLDDAASRVLKDLTQLEGIFLKQFHTFGDPNRVNNPKDRAWLTAVREFPNERVITVAYYSLVSIDDYEPRPSEFAEASEWVPLKKLPPLAFDHDKILNEAIATLRNELITKNIGFELLPKKFTLSQLQLLHEIILDKKFDKRNFRKSMKKMSHVVPLDEKQQGVDHKPAQLFQFDPNKVDE
ncbi:NUDIX domain-containing protein [bacterium]|nr:NUDIX domain-containing protein [bacterium]